MNAEEEGRYSRQLLIPAVGVAGQARLRKARVLCVGAGGLGGPALSYLVAAGVGTVALVDDDVVDESNLQRQLLFSTRDIGRSKAEAAAERLRALNPHVAVEPYRIRFKAANARDLVRAYDCVIDGSDEFATRYLVNDASVLERKTNVFASISRFQAQVTLFSGAGKPCYRCLFPVAPAPGAVPSCGEGGVLGAVAGLAGAWQATEVLKCLLGIGESLSGRLLLIDALGVTHRELSLQRDPDCPLCGDSPTIVDVRAPALAPEVEEIGAEAFAETIARGAVLLDVREPHEAALDLYPHSLHIPWSRFEERFHEIDLRRRYLVACRLGLRSLFAAQRLRRAGVAQVIHLRGGLLSVAVLADR
jgi:molybdopterin/thiamine biosynthesis adenylyltransferase/rhodanese-related sulfurtransferase